MEFGGAASGSVVLNPLRHTGFHLMISKQIAESGGGISTRNDNLRRYGLSRSKRDTGHSVTGFVDGGYCRTQFQCGAMFLRRGGEGLTQSAHAADHLRSAGLTEVLSGCPM